MPISVADCGAAEGAGAVPVAVVQPEAEAALAEALAALDEPGSKKPQHKPRKTQDGRAAHAASSITSQASQQHPKSTGPAPSATSPSPKTPVAVAGGPPADPPGATAHSAPAAGAAWLGSNTAPPYRSPQQLLEVCADILMLKPRPVSYTHLTLPTNREV